MNALELFAGAGGGMLGSWLLGCRTVGAVEVDPYCREVLLRRQEEGATEPFPVFECIREFDGSLYAGKVDLVIAGFPCQPYSLAGKRQGEKDDRNLWPDTLRVLREVRPRFALLENVPGLLAHDYFGEIIGGLAEEGFESTWDLVSAQETGARHRRKRLWILSYPRSNGLRPQPRRQLLEKRREPAGDREEPSLAGAHGPPRSVPNSSHSEGRRHVPKRQQEGRDAEPVRDGEKGGLARPNVADTDGERQRTIRVASKIARLEGPLRDEPHRRSLSQEFVELCDREGWWASEPGVG